MLDALGPHYSCFSAGSDDPVNTFWDRRVYAEAGESVCSLLFPEAVHSSEPRARRLEFRTCSHTCLTRTSPSPSAGPVHLVPTNMHIVSGEDYHAIPGRSPHAREMFKVGVLAAGVQASVDMAGSHPNALAATQGKGAVPVLCGDMNLNKRYAHDAMADVKKSSTTELAVHHVEEEDLLKRQEGK